MPVYKDFEVVDYMLSNETFQLRYHKDLDLYQTTPMPNEKELGKYYESNEYISHTDAKESFIDKIYQSVKKRALHSKFKLIEKAYKQPKRLLDIGVGTGDFIKFMSDKSWSVNGVEPNEQARVLAQQKLGSEVKLYTTLDDIPKGQFEVITLWHVLEHVPDYDQYLKQIKSLLVDGGLLIVAVPNFKSYDAQYYKNYWAAYDVPRHLWHFSKQALSNIFGSHNLKIESVKPMYFDSYYVSLLSEQYKTKKQRLLPAFCIGSLSNLKALFTGEFSSLIYLVKT